MIYKGNRAKSFIFIFISFPASQLVGVGVGKRGAYQLVHGYLLPRQYSLGTTLGFTGPVAANYRQ